jgi:hypothetical protein
MTITNRGVAYDYVADLLRTGLILVDLGSELVEAMPERVDGEPAAAVLIDMMAGSAAPAIAAAGPRAVAEARALMEATIDRILADLRTAAELGGQ